MKLSLCTNVFPLEQIPEACKCLRDIGYDGVELWHQYLFSRSLEEIKEDVLSLGLEVAQICPYFNVTGTKAELEESFRLAQQYITLAEALHCKNIRVFTGNVGAHEATAEQYAQGVSGLQTICDMSPSHHFVLETHPGSLMESADATLQLLHAVDRPNLKVNLQLPINNGKDDPYLAAQKLGAHTVHIHAHNWIGPAQDDHLTCLADGCYDFEKFISILHAQGFDGFISIEHADHYGREDPLHVAKREYDYFQKVKRSIKP